MCKNCQEKDKIIAGLKQVLKQCQNCNEEKYRRIKRLENTIKNLKRISDAAFQSKKYY